jgi:hypothetical protein
MYMILHFPFIYHVTRTRLHAVRRMLQGVSVCSNTHRIHSYIASQPSDPERAK